MKNQLRPSTVRIYLALAPILLLLAAVSCGGKSAAVAPTATQPPSATAIAIRTTGMSDLDEIIRLTLAGDRAGLVARLGYTALACVRPQQEGSPPPCEGDEPAGTVVDAFLEAGCGGNWVRAHDAVRSVGGPMKTATLFAVGRARPSAEPPHTEYRIAFRYDDSELGYWFDVLNGRIVGLEQGCGPIAGVAKFVDGFVLAPPP